MSDPTSPYSEEHEIFRRTVRSFLARELTPHIEAWEEQRIPDRSFWRRAGEAGILGAGLPVEYGGPGGDFLDDAFTRIGLIYRDEYFHVQLSQSA